MTASPARSVFTAIAEEISARHGEREPHLVVRASSRTSRFSPRAARQALYGPPRPDRVLRDAIWRQVVAEAQREGAEHREGKSRLLAVWLALPALTRTMHRITARLPVERADLEAEAVLALLEAVDKADPDRPDAGSVLIREAVNRAWSHAANVRREVPIADITAVEGACRGGVPGDAGLMPDDGWEVHITPPARSDRLAATIRFTEWRTRSEGERLGALAYCAGLADLVYRARRHEDVAHVGTLVLCPSGGPR